MKIGIAGYGYVGQAHEHILKEHHDIIISDPDKGHYGDLRHADAIIVCVSTPSKEMSGNCDVNNVCDVINDAKNIDVPILIKSTISPEGWRLIKDTCPNKNITFSPEFLRAETWKEDSTNQKDYYFGGSDCNFWSDIFLNARGKINIDVAQPEELILAKQLRNSYLALKVTFFNQIYDYCKHEEVDFENVRRIITQDKRIGDSHSHVTEKRGFGGHCFPKDTLATLRSSQIAGAEISLLHEAIEYNNKVRI